MRHAAGTLDPGNDGGGNLSLGMLMMLLALSPVGMVILAQGASWALGPGALLLQQEQSSWHELRLPCIRRCAGRLPAG